MESESVIADPLQLAIIGTGSEGVGLALRFALAGAHVTIGSRESARAAQVASALQGRHPGCAIAGAANEGAIEGSGTVILAVPFAHARGLIERHSGVFRAGTLMIDVTVPVVFEEGKPVFVEPPEGSAAEHLRAIVPEQVALACAFKTLPARLLDHVDEPLDCDDFICGDSIESRERASALVRRIPGLRPVDTGPLDSARTLERMTLLAIRLNKRYKRHGARFQVLGI
jgi:hypothetical protein